LGLVFHQGNRAACKDKYSINVSKIDSNTSFYRDHAEGDDKIKGFKYDGSIPLTLWVQV
jgi:hypothetical protein